LGWCLTVFRIYRETLSRFVRRFMYQYGLRGARGAVMTAGENGITRDLFNRYSKTRDIDIDEFPGARGFGFIRRVPVDAEMHFVHQARADDWPDFTIRAGPQSRRKIRHSVYRTC
ncbi:CHASE domain-containing protein, partial [Vibrio sp. PP-XX7]